MTDEKIKHTVILPERCECGRGDASWSEEGRVICQYCYYNVPVGEEAEADKMLKRLFEMPAPSLITELFSTPTGPRHDGAVSGVFPNE